jgi:hypothetical protein
MTLGNMRELGVQHLIAFCLNDACRHQAPSRGMALWSTMRDHQQVTSAPARRASFALRRSS